MAQIGDVPSNAIDYYAALRRIQDLEAEVRRYQGLLTVKSVELSNLQAEHDELARKHDLVMNFISCLPTGLEDMVPDYYTAEERHSFDGCDPYYCEFDHSEDNE